MNKEKNQTNKEVKKEEVKEVKKEEVREVKENKKDEKIADREIIITTDGRNVRIVKAEVASVIELIAIMEIIINNFKGK